MQLILDSQEKQRLLSRRKSPSINPSHQLSPRNQPARLETSIPSSAAVFLSLSQFQCYTPWAVSFLPLPMP